jgi:hypothetical protein
MEKSSWRTRGLEWFTGHALWELAKVGLSALFAWLVSLGFAQLIHAATFSIFLILVGIIGLAWVLGFIPKAHAAATTELNNARPLALQKLAELTTSGHRLLSSAPKNGATVSDFTGFWNEQIAIWTKAVAIILSDNWSKDSQDFFFSTTGLNMEQSLQQIAPEAKMYHLHLGRWLQNLEQLRQALPRN